MEKIKYSVLENLNDYKNLKIDTSDFKICRQPLFHGTTRLALDSGPEVMEKIHEQSLTILKAVKQYYQDHMSDPRFFDRLDEYHKKSGNHHFCDAVTTTIGDIRNFSYGDFYVTTNYLSALNFSCLSMGELGKRAYYNAIALKELKIDLGIDEAIDYIIEKHNQFVNSERVILLIDDILFEDLYTERGYPVLSQDENGNPDYFMCELAYDSEVSESIQNNNNYRVNNLKKYTFKLIKQPLFREGIGCFTEIKDYNAFLATSYLFNRSMTNADFYKI